MEMSPPPVAEFVATTLGTPAVARDALAVRSRSLGNSAALDQWRGLALVLVLISHGFYFTGRVHGVGRIGSICSSLFRVFWYSALYPNPPLLLRGSGVVSF